jgi:integrase
MTLLYSIQTVAGRRTLEVPAELRPLLAELAGGKPRDRHLFECERPHERAAHKPHGRRDLAEVPRVTAHAMRGLLATLTAERGLAGHLIAATLGHEDERTTMHAHAAPGPAQNAEGPRIAARPFGFPVEPRGIEPLTSRVRF